MNNRFFYKTTGADVQVLKQCFDFAFSIANKDADITRVVVYCSLKKEFETVRQCFKKNTLDALFKTSIVVDGCNKPVFCATKKTYNAQNNKDVVVCCHVASKDVYELDDRASAKYIIAISWVENGLDEWIKRWNAIDIKNPQATSISLRTIDPLSIIALTEMNIATGNSKTLIHPNDEGVCKTYVRAIHKYIPTLSADDLTDYLVANLGWENKNASKVGNLLQSLKDGKTFKGGANKGLKNYYKNWCDKLSNTNKPSLPNGDKKL